MNAPATEYAEKERELSDWLQRGDELKRTLRQGRIHELAASGDRLMVRPVMVEQPGRARGERDLWFGLSFWDWKKFRAEGFDGWMETTAGSGQPKVMILVEKAAQWLEERCRRQAEARRDGTMRTRRRTVKPDKH